MCRVFFYRHTYLKNPFLVYICLCLIIRSLRMTYYRPSGYNFVFEIKLAVCVHGLKKILFLIQLFFVRLRRLLIEICHSLSITKLFYLRTSIKT
jgi:hypothetical protein